MCKAILTIVSTRLVSLPKNREMQASQKVAVVSCLVKAYLVPPKTSQSTWAWWISQVLSTTVARLCKRRIESVIKAWYSTLSPANHSCQTRPLSQTSVNNFNKSIRIRAMLPHQLRITRCKALVAETNLSWQLLVAKSSAQTSSITPRRVPSMTPTTHKKLTTSATQAASTTASHSLPSKRIWRLSATLRT